MSCLTASEVLVAFRRYAKRSNPSPGPPVTRFPLLLPPSALLRPDHSQVLGP